MAGPTAPLTPQTSAPARPVGFNGPPVNSSQSGTKAQALASSPSLKSTVPPAAGSSKVVGEPAGLASPHELIEWVDGLLDKLEARFDSTASDMLSRLDALGSRVDAIETSLAELMDGGHGDGAPPPPSKSE